jgi:hypothetical protein
MRLIFRQYNKYKDVNKNVNVLMRRDGRVRVSISLFSNLSEKFIEKYKDKVDWWDISFRQNLSEKFIEKFENEVKWDWISKYQELSEIFIEEHKDKVNWRYILLYQELSPQIQKEMGI